MNSYSVKLKKANIFTILGQKKIDIQQEEKNHVLMQEIRQAESDIALAYINFENVIDPILIDYYIYELNALTLRYQYLITTAKRSGIRGIMPSRKVSYLSYVRQHEPTRSDS